MSPRKVILKLLMLIAAVYLPTIAHGMDDQRIITRQALAALENVKPVPEPPLRATLSPKITVEQFKDLLQKHGSREELHERFLNWLETEKNIMRPQITAAKASQWFNQIFCPTDIYETVDLKSNVQDAISASETQRKDKTFRLAQTGIRYFLEWAGEHFNLNMLAICNQKPVISRFQTTEEKQKRQTTQKRPMTPRRREQKKRWADKNKKKKQLNPLHIYDEKWHDFLDSTGYIGKWEPGSNGIIPNAWKQYRSFLTQQNLSSQHPINVAHIVCGRHKKQSPLASKREPKKRHAKPELLDQPPKKKQRTRKNSPGNPHSLHDPVVQEPKDDKFLPPLLGKERETSQDTSYQNSDDEIDEYFSPTMRAKLQMNTYSDYS